MNVPKISRTAFPKNTAGGMLLISPDDSLKLSRTPLNSLMPGGNKRPYILIQTSKQDFQVCLSMYVLLLPPALKG